VLASRSIQDPELPCEEALEPNPPRLTWLVPTARLPARAEVTVPTELLPDER
jgi:hypothetical protein